MNHIDNPRTAGTGNDSEPARDRLGNPVDPTVGYARGSILGGSVDEARKLVEARRIASGRIRSNGVQALAVFTGNPRGFPIDPGDAGTLCDEWFGPGLVHPDLRQAATGHVGAGADADVLVVNRTSGALIAAIQEFAAGQPVVSVSARGARAHASIHRGCALTGLALIGVEPDCHPPMALPQGGLTIVTTVSSNLDVMTDAGIADAIRQGHRRGAIVMLDEAYGARVRPILLGGRHGLDMGADLLVMNGDKAGLGGPRCGVVAGDAGLIARLRARTGELGLEARAPIEAGVMRALQRFDPSTLVRQAREGEDLFEAMRPRWGDGVRNTVLGPVIHEDVVAAAVLNVARCDDDRPVPCEITAAIGMVLLRDHGFITANTHGQPGASPALRLKPVGDALARAGGASAVAAAVDDAIGTVAERIRTRQSLAPLICG